MMNVKIESLKAGQEVVLANCRETGKVIARIGKNLYRVSYQGHEIDMQRNQLSINRDGRWVRY
jgi:hypothetical protein